jgi:hypothetical protein
MMKYYVYVTQIGETERHNCLELEADSEQEAKEKAKKRLDEEVITDWEYEDWFDLNEDLDGGGEEITVVPE